jgi:hypothetical protein
MNGLIAVKYYFVIKMVIPLVTFLKKLPPHTLVGFDLIAPVSSVAGGNDLTT